MKFVLDENFPKSAISWLEDYGHECIDLPTSTLKGSPDHVVLKLAIENKAVILTTDRDFFHTLAGQYPDHSGIVVIALKQPSRKAILEKLEWFLLNIPQEHWAERAFQLRDKTWISRPPLDEAE